MEEIGHTPVEERVSLGKGMTKVVLKSYFRAVPVPENSDLSLTIARIAGQSLSVEGKKFGRGDAMRKEAKKHYAKRNRRSKRMTDEEMYGLTDNQSTEQDC